MSKSEIIAELPRLKSDERRQVLERLCELEEADLLNGIGPTEGEKRILDQALTAYERDGDSGVPWREALLRLKAESVE